MATDSDLDLRGVLNPDFLALGLGGTNMMSMLWAVAMGRRAVGVEMRGDPFLGVHWNLRADFFHQLGLIDKLMLDRYGEQRIPRRGDTGKIFRLAEVLYSQNTKAGDIVADEIIDGFDTEQHIAGTIHHVEFIDDRWRDGIPNRVVTLLTPPRPSSEPDEKLIRTNMREVLDGPSTFQAGAASVLVLLRRYLEKMEQLDLDRGFEPRVRLFARHRVINTPEGFIKLSDGRLGFRIEEIQELNYQNKFVRIRRPGSKVIEIGVPELFMIAEGFHSTDAERLGFVQEDVAVDHNDGRGSVVAQADFLAGLLEVLVGGRLRRRISSEFDENGNEYWVRQIAVGHENDPEVGWCLIQVPDFKTFDPIKAGLVSEGTEVRSPEYFAAYETLVYDFYIKHVADVLDMPSEQVRKVQTVYGPKLFTLIERVGADPLIAPNGVIAGDSFGNGHFLTSGGAMTGIVGHSWRVCEYFRVRNAGVDPARAVRTLAEKIKEDTLDWLHVSSKEYSEAIPINFGAERIAQITTQSGISLTARAAAIDASRRGRHALLPLDPSDWRRLFLRPGRVHSAVLPELHTLHPALRSRQSRKREARISVALVASDFEASTLRFLEGALSRPGVTMGLVTCGEFGDLPQNLRDRLAVTARVENLDDVDQIVDAIRSMDGTLGCPDRLIGSADKLHLPLAEAREILGIEGVPAETARNFRDGCRMREYLSGAGLPIPRYARVLNVEDGLAFGTELGYYPVVVKPVEGAGFGNTWTANTEDELRGLLERLKPSPYNPLICEEFVRGPERTLDIAILDGVPAWFSATRFTAELLSALRNPGTAIGIVLPREQDDPADPVLRRTAFAALKALGMSTGLASMRWHLRADGRPIVTNVSASLPIEPVVTLMELAHEADMYRIWGNMAVSETFTPIPRRYAAGGVYACGLGERGIERAKSDFDKILGKLGKPEIRILGLAGEPSQGSNFFISFRHMETAVVDAAAREVANLIQDSVAKAPQVSTG